MNQSTRFLMKTIFLSSSLALVAACGDSGGNSTPQVDSDLPGIYSITLFQASDPDSTAEDVCEQIEDVENAANYLVLYSFVADEDPDTARLGGLFCNSIADCETSAANAPEPVFGYVFIEGSDADGWSGFGISDVGSFGDQCLAEVNRHTLTATGQTLVIETTVVDNTFPPDLDGTLATCRNGDALIGIDDPDLVCKERFVVEATFEQGL